MLESPSMLQLLVLLPYPFPACWPPSPGRVLHPSCKYAPSVMCSLSIRLLLPASAVYLPKAAGASMERKCIKLRQTARFPAHVPSQRKFAGGCLQATHGVPRN